MTQGDIHSRKNRLKNTMQEIEQSENISEYNKDILTELKNYLEAQDLSQDRISRYMYTWKMFAEYINWKIDHTDKEKLVNLVGDINKDNIKDKELSQYTKMEYKKAITKMYSHFLSSKRENFDGSSLTDFYSNTVNTEEVEPDRLPTPNTVRRLVRNTVRHRDKTFLMVLWASGGRIGEILGLKWKDVKLDGDLASVTFRETKTGGKRTVPIRGGFAYLKKLKEAEDSHGKASEYVFQQVRSSSQLGYNGAYNIIKRARKRSDKISSRKKTNPHAFRKGRATYLAAQGMNQAQLCNFFGWVQGSKHAAKYIRLSESDTKKALKDIYGMEEQEDEIEEDLIPVECRNCGIMNKWEAEVCDNCREVLTDSELFQEKQVEEKTSKFKDEIIKSDTEFSPESINKKAEEFVREEFNLN
jgi:integrase